MPYDTQDVTFVTTRSGDPSLIERNFAASPCFNGIANDRIIVQEGFSSAAAAYNDAIDRAQTDIIVFAHQDVYFPEKWLGDLNRSLKILDVMDEDWGVLGGWGINRQGQGAGFVYSVGLGIFGQAFDNPVTVDTLDEFVLILRKSSGLRFDPTLPHFHFYGMDICMAARKNNKKCYAISAFSVHNTSYGFLSQEFFNCYWHVRRRWREFLPVQTTCIKVSVWNEDLIVRKLKLILLPMIGRKVKILPRLEDPRSVLQFAALTGENDAVPAIRGSL
jgi:hypothetical protein